MDAGILERIVRAYRDAETYVLGLIADTTAAEEEQSGTMEHYWAMHQQIYLMRIRAEVYLRLIERGIRQAVIDAVLGGYADGVVAAAASVPGAPVPSVVPTRAIEALAEEAANAVLSQRTAILRSTEDIYRSITEMVSARAMATGAPYDKILQNSLNEYADRGITSFIDKAGRRWGIDTYAEMAVRTANNRAHNQGRKDQYQELGVELILTSWHHASAPQCIPYQGKILALSGQAGPRQVQDRATGKMITVEVTATLDEAIENGYHHPNCAHVDTAYIPGMPLPKVPDVRPEEHEAAQRQRRIERHIRKWKKREAVAISPAEQRKSRQHIRAWQKAQRDHVGSHDFLTRRYEREQIRQAK